MSDYRYITIPEPVTVLGLEYTPQRYAEHLVDNHPGFAKPASRARAGQRILQAYDEAEQGVAVLRDEDWQLLSAAAEDGEAPVKFRTMNQETGETIQEIPVPPRQLLPLIDAIADATRKDPREKNETAEAAE